MGQDSPRPASSIAFPNLTFSPKVEPRKDAIPVLHRDSASSRSSYNSVATPTMNDGTRPTMNHQLISGPIALSSSSPLLTPVPGNFLRSVTEEPGTPGSTIVEFGDLGRGTVPSAVQLVENMNQFFGQSHAVSGPRSNSQARGRPDSRETREGQESKDQSRSRNVATTTVPRDRSHSTHTRSAMPWDPAGTPSGRNAINDRSMADERINRFLQSMAQQTAQSAESEVLLENRSLYQRIAALQRTERELLAENQDLTRKLAAMKQHHERRARQWNEGSQRKDIEYETRVRELGEQLLEALSRHPRTPPETLSSEEITAWFDSQDAAWHWWATTFGNQDDQRLSSGLHPLQLQELCGEIRGFVRMNDTGGLPRELLAGGKEALYTLLNGMLAHFLCIEILASPMWVFGATSLGTLESPAGVVSSQPSLGSPGVGIGINMNSFSNVMPLRPALSSLETSRSRQFPPPLPTSTIPLIGTLSASFLGVPTKSEMERLVYMITDG